MKIQIKDKATGIVYTNEMNNKHVILSLNFCTSYTQATVQDEILINGQSKWPEHDIILPPLGSEPNWIDLIATQGDHEGEWVSYSNISDTNTTNL